MTRGLGESQTGGPAGSASGGQSSPGATPPLTRIGHYRILRRLGEGGMGIVYAGHDERLDRPVAIKILRAAGADESARKRLWKEARAAARINHPGVCQLYEIGEDDRTGSLFLVMELLEGESLDERLARGPVQLPEAVQITTAVLQALEALHSASIIHQDLKPSNVFLATHGVKLLDFGLAQAGAPSSLCADSMDRTASVSIREGLTGTPCYMAPEQVNRGPITPATDLFALGCVLFEMLAGKRPFGGASIVEVLHAVLYDKPPSLTGSPALAAVDALIRRALEKQPQDRYPSARSMLEALRATDLQQDSGVQPRCRALTRLIVLPFRILRHHETSDFLAVALPDAITNSLCGIDSVVVRSTLMASRLASSGELDLQRIGEEAQVDAILAGTILSDGEHIRVSTQLVEAATGTMLWTNTSQVSSRDVFVLQDDLVDRIVQSLTLPLTAREHRLLKHDVPASSVAYEYYLRANRVTVEQGVQSMIVARGLYLRCLETDPRYAPAWARLGRAHRLIGKFIEDESENLVRAEAAFQKSFSLNPDLALAHNFYTSLQCDLGHALDAMARLLKRAQTHRNDPDLFTGLVQACRYCGLLHASIAAHERARQLDPNIRTSVSYTFRYLYDMEAALANCASPDEYATMLAWAQGHEQEAIAKLRDREKASPPGRLRQAFLIPLRNYLEGKPEQSLNAIKESLRLLSRDPEARFGMGVILGRLNEPGHALETICQALEEGYIGHHPLVHHPWLESLRSHPGYADLLARSAERYRRAEAVFLENGGDILLSDLLRKAVSSIPAGSSTI